VITDEDAEDNLEYMLLGVRRNICRGLVRVSVVGASLSLHNGTFSSDFSAYSIFSFFVSLLLPCLRQV
jgi:hypothetical protein